MVTIKENSIDFENGDIDRLSNLIGADLSNAANGEVPQSDGSGGLSMASIQEGTFGTGTEFPSNFAEISVNLAESNLLNSVVSGSASITRGSLELELATGSTSSSSVDARIAARGPVDRAGYNRDTSVRIVTEKFFSTQNGRLFVYAYADSADPSNANKYMGIEVFGGGVVRFVTNDGSTEEVTDVSSSITTGSQSNQVIDFVLQAGSSATLLRNGSQVAQHTTNIPPSSDTSTLIQPLVLKAANFADSKNNILQLSHARFRRSFNSV